MASSTICSARWLDCWLSSCWAAAPVTPSASPVPAISGLMSARSTLTASPAVVPEPLTTLLGMATSAVCTRPFGDRGPAVMLTILRMCLPSSVAATAVIFAASAAVSRPLSDAGEHDDRGGAGHVARLRERLVLQVRGPDRLVAAGQEAALARRGRQLRGGGDHRHRDDDPQRYHPPRVTDHRPAEPCEQPPSRFGRPGFNVSRTAGPCVRRIGVWITHDLPFGSWHDPV